jgi:uncharacterized protein YggE
MKYTVLLFPLVASLLIPTVGWACGESLESGVISVQENATLGVKPDAALVRFSLRAEGDSAEQASKKVAAKGEDFSKQLKAKFPGLKYVEVSEPASFTGGGEMPPWMAERVTQPVTPSASVRITVLIGPNPKDVVRITDLARSFEAKTETRHSYDEEAAPAEYGILNLESTAKPLRDKALKEARERAELWASAVGKDVGDVRKIELACGSQPKSVAVSDSGKSPLKMYYPGKSGDSVEVETTVTFVFALVPQKQ